MKEINVSRIAEEIAALCVEANKTLTADMENCIRCAAAKETSQLGCSVFADICNNLEAAKELNVPICQDTGMAVVFLEIGQEVCLVGGDLTEAVNRGVAKGYTEGKLRCSVVADPLNRVNTGDNTPAVIHTQIVPGDSVKIIVAPKGFGSENMSRIYMLKPSDGRDGVVNAVVDCMLNAGGNPCPPVVIGVGIGGDFEQAALLAKKALIRDADSWNEDPFYAELENELLKKVNETGIGPQGFGGDVTALKVNVEFAPTHIAGLPVAVNMGCHVNRHRTAVIK